MSSVDAVESPQTGLVVHHLNNSRSQRILWLLEELEVPYTLKKYQRDAQMLAPKELLAVSPLGKSPIITDGDVTLAESGAIVEYIIDKYGKGRCTPPPSGKIDDLYYKHYSEGSLMPLIVMKLVFELIPAKSPFFIRPLTRLISYGVVLSYVQPELNKHIAMINAHFKKIGDKWLVGGEASTAADYMMMFPLENIMSESPGALGPEAQAYVRRNQARPAYKRALEQGGEYLFAKL